MYNLIDIDMSYAFAKILSEISRKICHTSRHQPNRC